MKLWKKFAATGGSLTLLFALQGTALAANSFADVTGHMAASSDTNDANWWESHAPAGMHLSDCSKIDGNGSMTKYQLTQDYELVVVKAGSDASSGDNSLTLFADAKSGEWVYADSNGNEQYDAAKVGDVAADKVISHIIVCDGSTTSSSSSFSSSESGSSTSTSDSFTGSQSGETDAPTEPNTAAIESGTPNSGNSAWLLIAMLGVVVGSAVVLKPSRAKTDR